MLKTYSIAEARDKLTSILRELERVSAIRITRRGTPVAMLVSLAEYERHVHGHKSFWDAYEAFCERVDLAQLDIDVDSILGTRDRSPGREISL